MWFQSMRRAPKHEKCRADMPLESADVKGAEPSMLLESADVNMLKGAEPNMPMERRNPGVWC